MAALPVSTASNGTRREQLALGPREVINLR
jgi:hypothetical protein